MKKLLLAIAAVMVLASCGGNPLDSGSLAPMYITMKATAEYIDGDAGKSDRVRELATEIRRYATDETYLTVDLLIDQVREEIRWDRLDIADTMLIEGLLEQLRAGLVERLGADPLSDDLRMSIETVTGWVILAARP